MIFSVYIVLLLSFKTSINPILATFLTDVVMAGTLALYVSVYVVCVMHIHKKGQVRAMWFVNGQLCKPMYNNIGEVSCS